MSMPKFPDKDKILSFEDAVNAILTSIAMEELALSHILNAEGEKIQYILAKKCSSTHDIISVNDSVASLISKITDLQFLLKAKLQLTKELIPTVCCKTCLTVKPPPPDNCCAKTAPCQSNRQYTP
jgi:hypothetical protein